MTLVPVKQPQNRIVFRAATGNLSTERYLLAFVEITNPRVRNGWELAVTDVPLDGTAELIHTRISQDINPQAAPNGVWCLKTSHAVLHGDACDGHQIYVADGKIKYTEQEVTGDEEDPVRL